MARNTNPRSGTVRQVRERDQWACAKCGAALYRHLRYPLSTQHRVARGMGGTRWPGINRPGNLITLCGSGTTGCHGWIEAHPDWSQAHGYSVRRAGLMDPHPEQQPVWTWQGWVLLLDGGDLEFLDDHPGVPGCTCGCLTRASSWALPTTY